MNVKILAIFVTAIVATIGVGSSYATSNTETIEKTQQKIKEIQDRIDDLENNKDVLQSKIQAKKDKLRAEQDKLVELSTAYINENSEKMIWLDVIEPVDDRNIPVYTWDRQATESEKNTFRYNDVITIVGYVKYVLPNEELSARGPNTVQNDIKIDNNMFVIQDRPSRAWSSDSNYEIVVTYGEFTESVNLQYSRHDRE